MANKSPLVGMFFLSWNDKQLWWQGLIEKEIGSDFYLCQLFSWFDGNPTNHIVVHLNQMSSWYLYKDQQEWMNSGRKFDGGSR